MLKPVTIEVEEGTWTRIKDRAKVEGRFVRGVVGDAFERYLGSEVGVVPPVVSGLPTSNGGRPTVEELKVLVNGVKPGSVTTGSEMTPRQREQRRVAHQNHARTHPEDVSQDPRDDKVGF